MSEPRKYLKVDPSDFPYLYNEHIWPWGPVKTVFEPGVPPADLVSNVNIAPFDGAGWLIVRQHSGWGIVGGTLEPGESYLQTLKRELREEAGCELLKYTVFGALRMTSLAEAPYRSHLPHPVSYRLLCVRSVRREGAPSNPRSGEKILEVASFPLEEACRRLERRPDDGPLLAEVYRMAALLREEKFVDDK